MKCLCKLLWLPWAFCFAVSAFALEPGLIVVNTTTKELKRTAHRLRIPVDQLKKARQTLQEATDLASGMKPYPAAQISSLIGSWQQSDRSRVKAIIDGFIQDLRTEAAEATDFQAYSTATSTAMSLTNLYLQPDYETVRQMLRNWPEPPASIADTTAEFRKRLEASSKQNALWRMINTDPDKALAIISSSADSGEFDYHTSAQLVQGLVNAGKNEDALGIIDKATGYFSQHATDPANLQAYADFVQMSVRNLDSDRANALINPLIAQLMKQPDDAECGGMLKSGNTSANLTCSEAKILNLLRGFPLRPGLVQSTLSSIPDLKSKVDSLGGIDGIYGGGGTSFVFNAKSMRQPVPAEALTFSSYSSLLQELKGKADANPIFVKRKLEDAAKGQQGIDMIINFAMMASYQDDALSSLALEIAGHLIYSVEPLQRRGIILQNLIRAYRQLEGEADTDLIKSGFILADQLREEEPETGETPGATKPTQQAGLTAADQLEAFLVAELSRDSFESALNYVHSMRNDALKLTCLIQIAQALGQPNF